MPMGYEGGYSLGYVIGTYAFFTVVLAIGAWINTPEHKRTGKELLSCLVGAAITVFLVALLFAGVYHLLYH